MKISKSQISNLVILLFILLFMFTPVGTTIKVWINSITAVSPKVVSEGNRTVLTNYNWKLKNIDSNSENYNLNEAKGKVILINQWATWCPPCIAELPSLQALYDDYGDKIVFLFVTNEEKEVVQTFLDNKNYKLPVFIPTTKTPKELFTRSIPATYLINKKGELVIAKKGAADWNSKKVRIQIDELLNK